MPDRKPLALPKDIVYGYDGSLPGFYCCVHESVYAREIPASIQALGQAQSSLFETKEIITDPLKARKVQSSVKEKLRPRILELIETVYFSCLSEKELHMLRFLLEAYRQGPSFVNKLGDALVDPLLKAERHLGGEAHLLKGFIRFSDHEGALLATITPKNFVLPFLVEHFVARYSQEDFMIYDKTHQAALLYQNGRHEIVNAEYLEFPKVDEREENYRQLWKQFYKTIAIEARTNPKCRMTHMPKRYWENMTEMRELL